MTDTLSAARETFTFGPSSCYVRESGGIWNVFTPSNKRGQGYGSGLIRKISEIFDARGVKLWLVCRDELVPWYEDLGFVETERFGSTVRLERPIG